jgi:hypothetical protein
VQLAEEIKKVSELKRQYVKGHQYLKNRRKYFTLPELYNVKADAEATIMQFQMTKPASHVILFTASIVNVYVRQQLINSLLNSILHKEFTPNGYWEYLEEKFQWTPTTRKLIAWTLFHTLLNNQPHKQHQQLIKYSVDWLQNRLRSPPPQPPRRASMPALQDYLREQCPPTLMSPSRTSSKKRPVPQHHTEQLLS